MKDWIEFLSFDKDPNEKVYGFLRVRICNKIVVIFSVIRRRDGDFFIANPSKSVNIMGQWKPSELAYFEGKEDRDEFNNLAREFVFRNTDFKGPPLIQNDDRLPSHQTHHVSFSMPQKNESNHGSMFRTQDMIPQKPLGYHEM